MLTIIGFTIAVLSALGLLITDAKWGIREVLSFKTGTGRRIRLDTSMSPNEVITGSKTTGFIMKTTVTDHLKPMDVTSVKRDSITDEERKEASKSNGFTGYLTDSEVTDILSEDLEEIIEEMVHEDEPTQILNQEEHLLDSSDVTEILTDEADSKETAIPDFLTSSVPNTSSISLGVYESTDLLTPELEPGKNLFENVHEVVKPSIEGVEVTSVLELTDDSLVEDESTGQLQPITNTGNLENLSSPVKITKLFGNANSENIKSN